MPNDPKPMNPKEELRLLLTLKNTFADPISLSRGYSIRKVIYFTISLILLVTGMVLPKAGVHETICHLLIMVSGVFFAYAFMHHFVNKSNQLLIRYVRLDEEKLEGRIIELTGEPSGGSKK